MTTGQTAAPTPVTTVPFITCTSTHTPVHTVTPDPNREHPKVLQPLLSTRKSKMKGLWKFYPLPQLRINLNVKRSWQKLNGFFSMFKLNRNFNTLENVFQGQATLAIIIFFLWSSSLCPLVQFLSIPSPRAPRSVHSCVQGPFIPKVLQTWKKNK